MSDTLVPGASENMPPSAEDPSEHAALIRDQLDRILASRGFQHSARMCRFLRFVVERSLSSEVEGLKESVIGVEVFDREPSYDPKLEPIVRVEARRLREKIDEYYDREGREDRVVIRLPKGGYAPAFEIRPIDLAKIAQPPLAQPAPGPAVEADELQVNESTSASIPARSKWTRYGLLTGAAVALCAVAVLVLLYGRHPAPVPSLTPLTSLPGSAFRPNISPDGKRVAFVWNGGSDNFDIYVKLINAGDPLRLTTNPAQDLDPVWSPDSSQIAFVRRAPGQQELFVIPALGGAERKIADLHPRTALWQVEGNYQRTLGPSWSPNGEQIAVADTDANQPDGIYLITVEGGDKRRLTLPDRPDESDTGPVLSPRGNLIAFVRLRAGASGSADIYVASLKGGSPKRLTYDHQPIAGLTWTPDGSRIIFSSQRDGEYRLWQVGASGGTPTLVAGADRRAQHPSLSSDGQRLVYTERSYSTKVWRVSLGSAGPGSPQPFLSSSRRDDSPQYSPDGRRVVFVSDRSGPEEIWICDANGANAASIGSSLNGFVPGTPRWSPGGTELVFDSRHEGFGAIYVTGANGGRPRRMTPETSNAMMPSWSNDGRSIYFASDRGGSWQIWKQPVAGGAAQQITKHGGREAKESRDGEFLYYVGAEQAGFWKVPANGGEEVPIPELAGIRHHRYWAIGERGIYYLSREESPWTVNFFDFVAKRTSPVFSIPGKPVFGSPSLAISPDGLTMLYSQLDRLGSDIMLLENFE